MEKVCIHIGLALFAIKRLCDTTETCADCPLFDFCSGKCFDVYPCHWDEQLLPDAALTLELTDTKESDTIKISSPD